MVIGDLLEGHGVVWLVRKIDPELKTGFLEDPGGRISAVGFDELEAVGLRRLCNVVQDWPTVTLPGRNGPLVSVQRASVRRNSPELMRFRDWVKIDEFQIGGKLYLNPELGLVYRDRLILSYSVGGKPDFKLPVDIPRDFASHKTKVARRPAPAKPKPPSTFFDHLTEFDDE